MRHSAFVLLTILILNCRTPGPNGLSLVPTDSSPQSTNGTLELQLPLLGQPVPWNINSHRGQVVLLDVWATWCDPCKVALTAYQALATEFPNEQFQVLGVNIDADAALIAPYLTENNIKIPILLDPEALGTTAKLQISMMPTSVIIDKKGMIRFKHEGFDAQELPQLRSEISQLLAESADSTAAPKEH
jgi:thiol-disulfide isomerase/thioredoxin